MNERYKMKDEELSFCKELHSKLRDIVPNTPAMFGTLSDIFIHKDWSDRTCVVYWELLMLALQERGLPCDLKHAIKYQVLSPFLPLEEEIPNVIKWLVDNPNFI